MSTTNEQNRIQKHYLDQLEIRMGIQKPKKGDKLERKLCEGCGCKILQNRSDKENKKETFIAS